MRMKPLLVATMLVALCLPSLAVEERVTNEAALNDELESVHAAKDLLETAQKETQGENAQQSHKEVLEDTEGLNLGQGQKVTTQGQFRYVINKLLPPMDPLMSTIFGDWDMFSANPLSSSDSDKKEEGFTPVHQSMLAKIRFNLCHQSETYYQEFSSQCLGKAAEKSEKCLNLAKALALFQNAPATHNVAPHGSHPQAQATSLLQTDVEAGNSSPFDMLGRSGPHPEVINLQVLIDAMCTQTTTICKSLTDLRVYIGFLEMCLSDEVILIQIIKFLEYLIITIEMDIRVLIEVIEWINIIIFDIQIEIIAIYECLELIEIWLEGYWYWFIVFCRHRLYWINRIWYYIGHSNWWGDPYKVYEDKTLEETVEYFIKKIAEDMKKDISEPGSWIHDPRPSEVWDYTGWGWFQQNRVSCEKLMEAKWRDAKRSGADLPTDLKICIRDVLEHRNFKPRFVAKNLDEAAELFSHEPHEWGCCADKGETFDWQKSKVYARVKKEMREENGIKATYSASSEIQKELFKPVIAVGASFKDGGNVLDVDKSRKKPF